MTQYHTRSSEETIELGFNIGKILKPGSIVCFEGDLAAGKTTFIKGLAQGASGYPPNYVNSPTFVYLNIYIGEKTIYHFDLYRLSDAEEFIEMGFEEHLNGSGICCIEWSERIQNLISQDSMIKIQMHHIAENERLITVIPHLNIPNTKDL